MANPRTLDDYEPSWDTTLALLSVSSHFAMTRIRDFAINIAAYMKDQQDPITVIGIENKYGIQGSLAATYTGLC
jgi:hypothetical protein